jgi:hypothetical protein
MKPRLGFALLALAGITTAAAAREERSGAAMLPPEMAGQLSAGYLQGFGEPPLWPERARQGYRTRVRLTIKGILLAAVSIRIDQYANGRLDGHVAYVDRGDRTEWRFPVAGRRFVALQAAFQRAGLWTIHPQFFEFADPNNICIDGMEMIFERADANGYRFANANAQCTASPAMLEAAATMIDISGAPARSWLR